MDTDKHRLGKSEVEKAGKGRRGERARKECHSGCRCNFFFFFIHLHLESECSHFQTMRENLNTVCAARRSKMGSVNTLVDIPFGSVKPRQCKILVG